MTVKNIAQVKPIFPFEAYSHIVSPIGATDCGGFRFTMPDISGVRIRQGFGAAATLHAHATDRQSENRRRFTLCLSSGFYC